MSEKNLSVKLKTWIELDREAARHNVKTFRDLIGKRTRLWAVVKSNAYGHGLYAWSDLMNKCRIDGFCVDSVVEGIKLRGLGIKKPILVIGPTVPAGFADAAKHKVTVSIGSVAELHGLGGPNESPVFHLKVDTGMHRRGILPEELSVAIKFLKKNPQLKKKFEGVFTHFAAAKDVYYPAYTERQLKVFNSVIARLAHAGFKRLIRHAAATGGTLLGKKYHLDAVRVGIGLYGLWPSPELELQLAERISLRPVLSWHSVVSEVKHIPRGALVGYDLTERTGRDTKIAIIPIGYWHGFPRSLSSIGMVLIHGKPARVLGRVSMDIIVVDVTDVPVAPYDRVTLIGQNGREEILARDIALRGGTTHYEFLTRLNPLIERVLR